MNTNISAQNQLPAPIIEIKQVEKVYQGLAGPVAALKGVSFQVYPQEFAVITGRSGSGKTTLVNVLTGLDRLTQGEVWVDGTPVHRLSLEQAAHWRGQKVGVVFQSFELLPSLTVLQNVMLPMDFAWRGTYRQQRQRALDLLGQVDIADHALKRPGALSGGQQQRVAIARALANNPAILFADEPTGSLDSETVAVILDLFAGLVQRGHTIFLVTHDQDIAQRADRLVTLSDGEIIGLEVREKEVDHAARPLV